MPAGIIKNKIEEQNIFGRFQPHPQFPEEGYYCLYTSDGIFLGNVGDYELDSELAELRKQGYFLRQIIRK